MRVITVGGGDRGGELDELFEYSSPYRYRFAGPGRVGVWMRDEEHDWRQLLIADAATGRVLDKLDDVAPEYGGSIELCRGGDRVVYQDPDEWEKWHFRDRTAGGWVDRGPFATRFDRSDEEDDDEVDEVDTQVRLVASADGSTVVVVGWREETRGGRTTSTTGTEVWRVGADGTPAVVGVGSPLFAANLDEDGRFAVSAGDRPLFASLVNSGWLTVWDAVTGQPAAGPFDLTTPSLKGDYGAIRVVFAPGGRRLAAAVAGRVFVWEVGGDPRELAGGPAVLVDLAFSPDGAALAAAGRGGTVRFWDAGGAPGRALTLPGKADDFDQLIGVDFAPDGQTCLAGFSNGTVAVWDLD